MVTLRGTHVVLLAALAAAVGTFAAASPAVDALHAETASTVAHTRALESLTAAPEAIPPVTPTAVVDIVTTTLGDAGINIKSVTATSDALTVRAAGPPPNLATALATVQERGPYAVTAVTGETADWLIKIAFARGGHW